MTVSRRSTQQGQSSWGALFSVAMLILAALTVTKLWGTYYDGYSVKKVVKALPSDTTLVGKSPKDIVDIIMRRLQVNTITLDPKEIKVTRDDKGVHVLVNYERRVSLFGNLDAIVMFSHAADIPLGAR